MIEIEYHSLSIEAVDNLILEQITREGTDYGAQELDVASKKRQLLAKLEQGDAVIVYSAEEGYCTIISKEEKQKLSSESLEP